MKKVAFLSEAIRRDNHASFRFFQTITVRHFYLAAPYGDFDPRAYSDTEQVPTVGALWEALDRFKPELIQGPEPYGSRRALAMAFFTHAYARRRGIPYFFPVLENRPPTIRFGPLAGWVMNKILGWYGNDALFVLWGNNGALENLRAAKVGSAKLVEFRRSFWGVDPALFFPNAKLRSPNPRVVFVGRVDEEKGLRYLLEAIPTVVKTVPRVEFEIIGQGPLDKFVADWIERHRAQKFVHRRGVLQAQALTEVLQRAWVSVTPSITHRKWEEQVGLVNLQSMACQTPVVSTRSGAIPEYVEHRRSGYLVPQKAASALARALTAILTNRRLWLTLSKGGYARVQRDYLAPVVIAELERIIIHRAQ